MPYGKKKENVFMGNVKMKDVAKRAGVSVATVSYVINNTKNVLPETRERVIRALTELDYRPNSIAKSLRQKMTNTIGVIISDASNPFFTSMFRGIDDVFTKLGYQLIVCSSDEKPEKERKYLELLSQKQVDGIILAPTGGNRNYINDLLRSGLPMIFIDRYLEDVKIPAVVVDNTEASYQATQHLINMGHRRIGILVGLKDISSTKERLNGYEAALKANGIPLDPELIKSGYSNTLEGYKAMLELLNLPSRPTAVFGTNNLMTIGLMQALQNNHVKCPEEIAVVGFDDFEWATAFRPFLTTVAQPTYELGKTAAEMLLKSREEEIKVTRVILHCQFMIRESCGCLLPHSQTQLS